VHDARSVRVGERPGNLFPDGDRAVHPEWAGDQLVGQSWPQTRSSTRYGTSSWVPDPRSFTNPG
jgi:hypothetical protein